jgi:predicted phosphoadenosine phosphosulfate sulfurtransferase
VREMPQYDCIINLDNHQFDFYKYPMLQEDMYEAFSPWYHRHECRSQGRTICLVGIRAQESLNRWRAIANKDKAMYESLLAPTPLSPPLARGEMGGGSQGVPVRWTTRLDENVYAGYPLYDWTAEDIWIANAKCRFDYNKLYDLYHYAGLTVHQMRVASPFNDWAIGSLKLYRVIEPNIWGRMVGRVNGANFCAIYGETHAVGWKNIKLPKGHTWKSYVEFLMKTLPEDTRKTYEEKFSTSIKFWLEKGGCLSEETITELQHMGVRIQVKGKTNYKTDKPAVSFTEYPDDLDVKEFQTVPSYKRMAICILKNDHLCKYMGFSQTHKEAQRRREAIEKYRAL